MDAPGIQRMGRPGAGEPNARGPGRGAARIALLLGVVVLLGACGPRKDAPAPVGDLSISSGASQGGHVVQSGDTLYSVAFRYGLDFRDIATWNGIDEPYTIFVGQNLRLEPLLTAEASAPRPVERRQAAPAPAPAQTREAGAPVELRVDPTVRAPVAAPTGPATGGAAKAAASPSPAKVSGGGGGEAQKARSAGAEKPPGREKSPEKSVARAPETKKNKAAPTRKETPYTSGPIRWQWPTNGPILRTFSTRHTGRKGIDIGGKIGEPVRAAAGGKIVYSGSGLVGYGELIIVKHNENYLSAYAHNSERLVREGATVKQGEKIALKGAAGKQPQLHFEIRRNGKPVNPLKYLPKR